MSRILHALFYTLTVIELMLIPFIFSILADEINIGSARTMLIEKSAFAVFFGVYALFLSWILLLLLSKVSLAKLQLKLMFALSPSLIIFTAMTADNVAELYKQPISWASAMTIAILMWSSATLFETLKPNAFVGIRSLKTLQDSSAWQKTHVQSAAFLKKASLLAVFLSFLPYGFYINTALFLATLCFSQIRKRSHRQ